VDVGMVAPDAVDGGSSRVGHARHSGAGRNPVAKCCIRAKHPKGMAFALPATSQPRRYWIPACAGMTREFAGWFSQVNKKAGFRRLVFPVNKKAGFRRLVF